MATRFARLILIMPPQAGVLAGFATGLLSLRAYVMRHEPGLAVSIMDLSTEVDEVVPAILAHHNEFADGPILFGITTTTATYQAALSTARNIRGLFGEEAVIVLGGPHAGADADNVVARHPDCVDFVVRGEGERSLLELVRRWPDVAESPGLTWRDRAGVMSTAEPPLLSREELDEQRLNDDWFLEDAYPGKFDHFTYVSARGCPLKCHFCSVANQAIRAKSATVIQQDVTHILRHGYARIAIEDNFFAHTPKRTVEVCDALSTLRAQGRDFSWDCQTRVEAAARAGTAEMLRAAGCAAVYLGVEGLTGRVLSYLGKTLSPDRYIETLEARAIPRLLAAKLKVFINIQFGLPDEAGDYLKETQLVLERLGRIAQRQKGSITVFPQLFVVYPGTFHSESFHREGTLWSGVFEDFTAWERDEDALTGWLGRYFAHGVGGLPLGILDRGLLKERVFKIDAGRLLRVQAALDDLEGAAGVTVFKYRNYLAPAAHSALPAPMEIPA